MNRFEARRDGLSWKIVDTEIKVRQSGYYSPVVARTVQWCTTETEANALAENLNNTRGHARDEPKCCVCGTQPASGDKDYPRCGPCWSRLADMHG
jgi:hypothetical protein